MTVEEIEIIVTAKVEEALKEFEKFLPAIREKLKQAEEAFQKIDTKKVKNKLQQAVNFMKKKIQDFKKSSENNEIAIKVNNKDAKKQITQLEKEIDSLQKKITGRQLKLDITNNALDKIRNDTNQSVIKEMPDAGNRQIKEETYKRLDGNANYNSLVKQSDKLNNEIEKYNELLNVAKSKMAELNQETKNTSAPSNKLKNLFGSFKQKIEQVKPSIIGIKNGFKGMPQITQSITNSVKNMGKSVKVGLGHVLRYAGALFSMQGIYSTLSSCASTWLSSQNAGAKQLSANIDYMKYAMGSALAPAIQFVTNLVYQLMKAIQSVAYALTGVNIFANASAKSYNSMAKSAGKAAKASKSNHVADFDEIHNIQKDSSGSGSAAGATPNFDLSKIENLDNTLIKAIKNGDWYKVGEELGKKINESLEKIPWNKIQNSAKKVATNIADFINGFIDGTDWSLIGSTIGNGINTALIFTDTFFKRTNFEKIGKAVATTLNSGIKTQDWKLTGRTIADGINSAVDTAYGFVKNFDWANFGTSIGEGIEEAIKDIDWSKLLDTLWTGFKGLLVSLKNLFFTSVRGSVVENHTELLVKMWGLNLTDKEMEELKKDFEDKYTRLFINGDWSVLTDSIKTLGRNIVEGIKQGMHEKIRDLKDWIKEKFDESIIGAIVSLFQIHSPSKVMYEIGQYIVQGLLDGIASLIGNVPLNFGQMKENALKKIEEMKNGIGTKIGNIKNNVLNWAGDVKGNMSNCWENCCKTVGNKLETMKSSISTGLSRAGTIIKNWDNNTGNTFSTLASNAGKWGRDLAENMANGIKRNTEKVTSAVSNVASKIKSFLHFTEPDEGPLSNFHTYMPDMIDLMVYGIRQNVGKVKSEMENMASVMSYAINADGVNNITQPKINTDLMIEKNNNNNKLNDIISKLSDNAETNSGKITLENKMIVNGREIAKVILDDLNDEAKRRGYKPILEH